jgi:hypothetical protein
MTGDVDIATIPRRDDVHTRFVRHREELQIRHAFNILALDFGVARMMRV